MYHLRFFAGAAEAAGQNEITLDPATLPDPDVLLRELPITAEKPALAQILQIASFLVDGNMLGGDTKLSELPEDAQIDVLPPFAGG